MVLFGLNIDSDADSELIHAIENQRRLVVTLLLSVPQKIAYQLGRESRQDENALDAVWSWLTHSSGGFVVVLGDFGSGKSFLLREVARRFLKEPLAQP